MMPRSRPAEAPQGPRLRRHSRSGASGGAELSALGLEHLAHEVTGRDVHIEVPLTLPGGVDGLRERLGAIPGVRSVRTRAIGSLRRRQTPEMPFTVQDEIRELKGER